MSGTFKTQPAFRTVEMTLYAIGNVFD